MPKTDDRHLTTTQLSALLDNQLSAEELAICNTHLQTCQQCQSALAGLKQTVGLLQALPEPAMPRSFVLPTGITYLQERPPRQEQQEEQRAAMNTPAPVRRRLWQYYVRRSLRAVSTIAAVIGLVFLLSGILPLLPHGGGTTLTSSAPAQSSANKPAPTTNMPNASSAATATAQKAATNNQHETAGKTPASVSSASGHDQARSLTNQPQPPSLPLPNLGMPLGRQEVGFTLLVLGIIGALLTRRRQRERLGRDSVP